MGKRTLEFSDKDKITEISHVLKYLDPFTQNSIEASFAAITAWSLLEYDVTGFAPGFWDFLPLIFA